MNERTPTKTRLSLLLNLPILLLLAVFGPGTGMLSAQTNYYTRQAGAWSNASNVWSTVSHTGAACSCSPGTTLGGSNVVTLSNSVTSSSALSTISGSGKIVVQSGDTLTITTPTLTIGGSGNIVINSGGVFVLNGALNMSGSTGITNNGKAVVNGNVTNSGSAVLTNNNSFIIYGNLITSGGAAVNGSANVEVSGTVSGPGTTTVAALPSTWGLAGNAGTNSHSNFIGTTDTAALSIRTNSAEVIRVKNDGTVQLNNYSSTTGGMAFFDNNGILRKTNLTGNSTDVLSGDGSFHPSSGSAGWTLTQTGTLQINNGYRAIPTYALTTPQYYSVGIGTATPTQALTVTGNSIADTVMARNTIAIGSALTINGDNVGLYPYGKNTITCTSDLNLNSPAFNPMTPTIKVGNTLLNAHSGNVGIGTRTPAYKLDVNGTIQASGLMIAHGGLKTDSDLVVGGNLVLAKPLAFPNGLSVTGDIIGTGNVNATALNLTGGINSGGDVVTTGMVKASGLSLSQGLSVAGDITSTGTVNASTINLTNSLTLDSIYVRKQILVNQGLLIQGDNAQSSGVKGSIPPPPGTNSIDAMTSDLLIQSSGMNFLANTIINAKSNGNVGIGTYHPTAKLHVSNGDIQDDGALTVNGDANFAGNFFARQGIATKGSFSAGKGSFSGNLNVNGILHALNSLVVDSNFTIGGDFTTNGNLNFAGNRTIAYFPASNGQPEIISYGIPNGKTHPIVDPCYAPNIPTTANAFQGTVYAYGVNANGAAVNSIAMGFDGSNGFIDVAGTSTVPGGTRLLMNYYCGKDIFMCTGSNGGNVHISDAPSSSGAVYLGTTHIGTSTSNGAHPNALLTVSGEIVSQAVYVRLADWPDYVFRPTYQLPKLSEIESFYKQNQHLPEIPTEKEISEKGADLGEMNKLLLKKVEELTLYLVEQQKQIDALKNKVESIK